LRRISGETPKEFIKFTMISDHVGTESCHNDKKKIFNYRQKYVYKI